MLSLDKIPEKIVMCHLSSLNCVRLHCTGKGDIWYRISIKAGTYIIYLVCCRDAGVGVEGLGKSVNPIPTRGGRIITT